MQTLLKLEQLNRKSTKAAEVSFSLCPHGHNFYIRILGDNIDMILKGHAQAIASTFQPIVAEALKNIERQRITRGN